MIWVWVLLVLLVLFLAIGGLFALRRRQRSGDVLAAAGRGTTNSGGDT